MFIDSLLDLGRPKKTPSPDQLLIPKIFDQPLDEEVTSRHIIPPLNAAMNQLEPLVEKGGVYSMPTNDIESGEYYLKGFKVKQWGYILHTDPDANQRWPEIGVHALLIEGSQKTSGLPKSHRQLYYATIHHTPTASQTENSEMLPEKYRVVPEMPEMADAEPWLIFHRGIYGWLRYKPNADEEIGERLAQNARGFLEMATQIQPTRSITTLKRLQLVS